MTGPLLMRVTGVKRGSAGFLSLLSRGGRPLYFLEWRGPRLLPAFMSLIFLSSSSSSRTSFSSRSTSSGQHLGGLIMMLGRRFFLSAADLYSLRVARVHGLRMRGNFGPLSPGCTGLPIPPKKAHSSRLFFPSLAFFHFPEQGYFPFFLEQEYALLGKVGVAGSLALHSNPCQSRLTAD